MRPAPAVGRPWASVRCAASVVALIGIIIASVVAFFVLSRLRAAADDVFVAELGSTHLGALAARIADVHAPVIAASQTLGRLLEAPPLLPPSESSDPMATLQLLREHTHAMFMQAPLMTANVAFMLADGNRAVSRMLGTQGKYAVSFFTFASNATNETHRCCGVYDGFVFDTGNGARVSGPVTPPMQEVRVNTFFPSFQLLSQYAKLTGSALEGWFGPYPSDAVDGPVPEVTYSRPLVNASGSYRGYLHIGIRAAVLVQSVLQHVDGSDLVEAIVVTDTADVVIASSASSDQGWASRPELTEDEIRLRPDCTSNARLSDPLNVERQVLCMDLASQHGYLPLRAAANTGVLQKAAALRSADVAPTSRVGTVVVAAVRTNTASPQYFVASAALQGPGSPAWVLTAFFRSESVVGDRAAELRIAALISVAVAVATGGLAFALLVVALLPLSELSNALHAAVTTRPNRAACNSVQPRALVREIYDLRCALSETVRTLTGFTVFVPWDFLRIPKEARGLSSKSCIVLCAELQGLVSALHGASPVDATLVLSCFVDELHRVINEAGGFAPHLEGDNVIAVFGSPSAVPNPEVRAVLAALMLVRSPQVAPLLDAFDSSGLQAQYRVGVSSGRLLLGDVPMKPSVHRCCAGAAVVHAMKLLARASAFDCPLLVSESVSAKLPKFFVKRALILPVPEPSNFSHTWNSELEPATLQLPYKLQEKRTTRAFHVVGMHATAAPDELLRIRAEDENFMANDDCGTHAGTVSSSTRAPGHRNAPTVRLVDAAYNACPLPPIVNDTTVKVTDAFNRVSRAYTGGRFRVGRKRAARLLSKLSSHHPYAPSLEALLELFTQALQAFSQAI